MPLYKVKVREVRNVGMTCWVRAASKERARELAEFGTAEYDDEDCYVPEGRSAEGDPELVADTPLEHLEKEAGSLCSDELWDTVIRGILAVKRDELRGASKKDLLQWILDEVGEDEAVRLVADKLKNTIPF